MRKGLAIWATVFAIGAILGGMALYEYVRTSGFSDWHEELAYLSSLSNPTPAQWRRKNELADRAFQERWETIYRPARERQEAELEARETDRQKALRRLAVQEAAKMNIDNLDAGVVCQALRADDSRQPPGEQQTDDWLIKASEKATAAALDKLGRRPEGL
jgi:hypothetical protein